ncbi:hypothetical protein [Pseudarthrobacter sp. NamE5]|uniref:hypothetical protein n=1 Tax=Pseudarthrobacter sp. NamE5 TaxID=2576839 RepID=UPI00110A51A2|nr:hypothetical protein [Pseudarthrobacter sp. NamE5]TLM88248.1 hypothetical protein FDW84_01685 [Pseudarthrobacter sp. NamE5]
MNMLLPQGEYIRDWTRLSPGDRVELVQDTSLSYASVDTVAESGEIVWLLSEATGQRTLHLAEDPIELYQR